MFAAGVILFMGGGWLVDKWLGTLPAFTLAGAALGAVLGTLSIWRRLMPVAKDPGTQEKGEDDR